MKAKITFFIALFFVTKMMFAQNLDPSVFTKQIFEEIQNLLPFENTQDFDNAKRGFIATVDSGAIYNEDGSVSYSLQAWDFLKDSVAATANPSLWRQGQLNSINGLFEVVKDKIYQIRGFDLANMSFIRTDNGWVVIDPLSSEATAKAGYKLIKQYIEKGISLPVKAIIITHPHEDHYGGVRAIIANAPNSDIQIIAPKGFYENAMEENLLAGPAMQRRAIYMYGMMLPFNGLGNIGSGLGQTNSTGPNSIPVPTTEIDSSNEKNYTLDGLDIEFIYATDVEAPVEFMMYFPQMKAFCVAELMNPLLHNLITLRGAKVRNGQLWSKAIDKALQQYGDEVECSFSSHNWPMWGNENIVKYWTKQRDMYRFIHDQTLHLANQGNTPIEIAEILSLPENIANDFHNRGYYGTVSHDVKAQYQLYFGWFDGNPANLYSLPPVDAGKKYVEAMGGEANVLNIAQKAYNEGDYRWGAMLLNHLVFANPENQNARNLLADVYTQLGYQAESGPWRNFYLSGASELRNKPNNNLLNPKPEDVIANLNGMSPELLFDYLGVKIDGQQAAKENFTFNIELNDLDIRNYTLILNNGALTNRTDSHSASADATVTAKKLDFVSLLVQPGELDNMISSGKISINGNEEAFKNFLSLIDLKTYYFNIIEP